jgi:hypothetical protein
MNLTEYSKLTKSLPNTLSMRRSQSHYRKHSGCAAHTVTPEHTKHANLTKSLQNTLNMRSSQSHSRKYSGCAAHTVTPEHTKHGKLTKSLPNILNKRSSQSHSKTHYLWCRSINWMRHQPPAGCRRIDRGGYCLSWRFGHRNTKFRQLTLPPS